LIAVSVCSAVRFSRLLSKSALRVGNSTITVGQGILRWLEFFDLNVSQCVPGAAPAAMESKLPLATNWRKCCFNVFLLVPVSLTS
jgi:hypothetical protein